MYTATVITFIFQLIVKRSESICGLVDSEIHGRLKVSQDMDLSTECANNLLFKSTDGTKYCLKKYSSPNSFNDRLTLLTCVTGREGFSLALSLPLTD